jgi:hypothetical protein
MCRDESSFIFAKAVPPGCSSSSSGKETSPEKCPLLVVSKLRTTILETLYYINNPLNARKPIYDIHPKSLNLVH